jgi:hypothetical protein
VLQTLVIDYLKAAVTRADWFETRAEPEAAGVRRAPRHRDPAHQAVHTPAIDRFTAHKFQQDRVFSHQFLPMRRAARQMRFT